MFFLTCFFRFVNVGYRVFKREKERRCVKARVRVRVRVRIGVRARARARTRVRARE
jgi:hypothetical protein